MQLSTGSVVEIAVTKDDVVDGIFYQDQEMRHIYHCFPEMVFVDATYKLKDGNCETEIIVLWMVAKEDEASIGGMVKKHNPDWNKMTTIMADKDFVERDVLKDKFLNAQVRLQLREIWFWRLFRRWYMLRMRKNTQLFTVSLQKLI